MSRNIQISEDLFTDLLIYFGIQTEAEPTEYRRQQIHDALALKVQAMNNRIRYKQHLGYEGQTGAQNAPVCPLTTTEDLAENARMDRLFEQGRQLGYHT